MILLCGIPTEEPLARVIAEAENRGVEHVVLNQRLAGHSDIDLVVDGPQPYGRLFVAAGQAIDLANVSGVYVRMMDSANLPEHSPARSTARSSALSARSQFLHTALLEWFEIASCRVLNRPSAMASNMSKPYQAQLIVDGGFATPPTLVTSDPDAVRLFRARHGRLIFKSTSSVRSIVRELDDSSAAELERIRDLPTQFQAMIPGEDVRVHVVGRRCFATRIRSKSVDYRYAHHEGNEAEIEPMELPRKIKRRCRKLSRTLELPLCGIDLRHSPDDEWYCLEVNPSPAYSYYEDRTGQPIAAAIVDHLAGAAR